MFASVIALQYVSFVLFLSWWYSLFCNPGFMMNTLALLKENPHPSDDEIKEFLAGNLCRCSGYEGQLRGIKNYLNYLEEKGNE